MGAALLLAGPVGAESDQAAWYVVLSTGNVSTIEKAFGFGFAWCVRGGMNADQY